jgi:glutamine amidotransferase
MTRPVTLIETGVANIASVRAAFERLGARLEPARSAADVAEAERVVLPGVGAFAAGMAHLESAGLVDALKTRIQSGRPTLTVCLGLQLLMSSSEESPGARGLGVIDAPVTRFQAPLRVPQLGWNRVIPAAGAAFLSPGYAYFANSYRLEQAPEGWEAATADYGGPFVAALRRGEVLACQFHPELSGPWGAALLQRWLEGGLSC